MSLSRVRSSSSPIPRSGLFRKNSPRDSFFAVSRLYSVNEITTAVAVPFLVINGDIFCDWNPALAAQALSADKLAHLILVPNPPQHPQGDFVLDGASVSASVGAAVGAGDTPSSGPRLTFSGIGIYRAEMFAGIVRGSRAKLAPLLVSAMAQNKVSGELHAGTWLDIGTPERLAALNASMSTTNPVA